MINRTRVLYFLIVSLMFSVCFMQERAFAAKRELTPAEVCLQKVKIKIKNEKPVAIIEPGETNPHANVEIENTNDDSITIHAEWKFASFMGTPVAIQLPATLTLEAGQKVSYPLPVNGLYPDCWQLDYTISEGQVTRKDKTYLAVMKIHNENGVAEDGFNFSIACGVHGNIDKLKDTYWSLQAMGANMLRFDLFWQEVEPRKDVWNFRRYDRVIKDMKHYNIEPQVILCYNTPWAVPQELARSKDSSTWKMSPPNLDLWKVYVAKVVDRYKDSVRYWEVWNEADLWGFWRGTTEQYAALLQASYKVIHENDPQALVMTSGFATLLPHSGRRHMNLQRDILHKHHDAFDIHAFHQHGEFELFERVVNGPLKQIRSQSPASKPLFFNETSVPASNEADQAANVAKKIALAKATGAIGHTWFKLLGKSYNWGLMTDDYEPRPAYAAYGTMVDMFKGRKPEEMIDLGKGNYCYTFADDWSRVLAYWSESKDASRGLWTLKGISPEYRAEVVALTGNKKPAGRISGKVILKVTEQPEYLLLGSTKAISLDKPIVRINGVVVVYPDRTSNATIKVSNPFKDKINIKLSVYNNSQIVALDPGQESTVEFPVSIPEGEILRYGEDLKLNLNVVINDQQPVFAIKIPAIAGAWIPSKPFTERPADFVVNLRPQIQNLFDFDPGSDRYVHAGAKDLSAKAWTGVNRTANELVVKVEVRDNIHKPAFGSDKLQEGDSLQLDFIPTSGRGDWRIVIADKPGGDQPQIAVLRKIHGNNNNPVTHASVTRNDGYTSYNIRLGIQELGFTEKELRNGVGFNFVVTDNDIDQIEGWAELVPGYFRKTRIKGKPVLVRFQE